MYIWMFDMVRVISSPCSFGTEIAYGQGKMRFKMHYWKIKSLLCSTTALHMIGYISSPQMKF